MRKFQPELKVYLRNVLLTFRRRLDLTQEQMAAKLHMTPRSYSDLERGKTGFSAVSLVFLLYSLSAEESFHLIHAFVDAVFADDMKEAE